MINEIWDIYDEHGYPTGRTMERGKPADIYFIKMEFDLDTCILQEEEVMDVKTVMVDEILKMIRTARYRDDEYLSIVEKAINNIMK